MNVHLQKKSAFKVVGFKKHFPVVEGKENFEEIASMWASLTPEMMGQLMTVSDGEINGFLGVSDENGQENFNYLIGTTSRIDDHEELASIDFPEAEWAKFECTGPIPHAMMQLKKEIIYSWLPNSDYDQLPLPRFEIYFQGDMTSDSYKSELWLPVRRR
ncbi:MULTISPECIES: GyrI-like domain-containing protein [Enterococcus]|uniref:AraC family transcriptional regulator n=1 Tax=Candidatus Enterococcus murrayae TaxID=2815321 RepID=A0ABS3HMZ9_9ENTE|nr:GyrI-like domain-containing protein [Enterococcus sp. MJM16]MBO0454813.1 AraC family transcriptional regulator [Enterococcus sp. MJM16]